MKTPEIVSLLRNHRDGAGYEKGKGSFFKVAKLLRAYNELERQVRYHTMGLADCPPEVHQAMWGLDAALHRVSDTLLIAREYAADTLEGKVPATTDQAA